ncbi:hypothetical protein PR048_016782 [Dryococelus australis]|uniref:Uncharacterized protein n=1 Tax=Dryococelus australis TaxID=614101 RepID=A0ABQ9H7S1_9NEOP|nr:hypothetical protein PR048_016782 [Dryococelus australis]
MSGTRSGASEIGLQAYSPPAPRLACGGAARWGTQVACLSATVNTQAASRYKASCGASASRHLPLPYTLHVLVTPWTPVLLLAWSAARVSWSCVSKAKKRGSDTGDTNTRAWRLIAPTRKACSVSVTKAKPGHSRIFASRNRAERCRWSADFLGDLPFLSPLHSGAAPFSPHFTPIGSQHLINSGCPDWWREPAGVTAPPPTAGEADKCRVGTRIFWNWTSARRGIKRHFWVMAYDPIYTAAVQRSAVLAEAFWLSAECEIKCNGVRGVRGVYLLSCRDDRVPRGISEVCRPQWHMRRGNENICSSPTTRAGRPPVESNDIDGFIRPEKAYSVLLRTLGVVTEISLRSIPETHNQLWVVPVDWTSSGNSVSPGQSNTSAYSKRQQQGTLVVRDCLGSRGQSGVRGRGKAVIEFVGGRGPAAPILADQQARSADVRRGARQTHPNRSEENEPEFEENVVILQEGREWQQRGMGYLWKIFLKRHRKIHAITNHYNINSLRGNFFVPPNKTNRVQSQAGSLPDFRKWESCRTMPLVGGFSRGLPPPPSFRHCSKPQCDTGDESQIFLPLVTSLVARFSIARNSANHSLINSNSNSAPGPEACRNLYTVPLTIWKVRPTPSRAERTRSVIQSILQLNADMNANRASCASLKRDYRVDSLFVIDTRPPSLALTPQSYNDSVLFARSHGMGQRQITIGCSPVSCSINTPGVSTEGIRIRRRGLQRCGELADTEMTSDNRRRKE